MKANKVGISLYNAYAYVLFRVPVKGLLLAGLRLGGLGFSASGLGDQGPRAFAFS